MSHLTVLPPADPGDHPPVYPHAQAMALHELTAARADLAVLRTAAEKLTLADNPIPEALADEIRRWEDTIAVLTLRCSHPGCPVWVDTTAQVDDTTTPTPGTCHTHTGGDPR